MPLLVLPANEAIKSIRLGDSRWPRTAEAQADRLCPVAQPQFYPSFKISRNDLIFTVGSCFARNIEKQLILEGYNVAVKRFEPPPEMTLKADPDALLNRYVIYSIANELRWAFGDGKPFKRKAYVQLGNDQWFDPHQHPLLAPASFEVVERQRTAVRSYMALAGEARIFIMTLGLAEAWFDKHTGLYLNGVLPPKARVYYPDRFEFHLLDYNQILSVLGYIHSLLVRFGHPDFKMLVTVSPVAMNTTFTGGEVLTANTYSKAVQRAAVEAFVRQHDNVDYFPSYESVTLSDRKRAWRADQAHASDELVRLNVLRMIEAYSDQDEGRQAQAARATDAFSLVQQARDAAGLDAPDEAIAAYQAAVTTAPNEALILLEFGQFLLEQEACEEAIDMIEASTRNGSGPYGGYFQLARAFAAAERLEEAAEAAVKALEFQPSRPGILDLSSKIAFRQGRLDEAIDFTKAHLALEPNSQRAKERLATLMEKARPKLKRLLGSGNPEGARRRRAGG